MAADSNLPVFNLLHFLCIGHLIEAQLLGYLRTYLGSIAINSLATTNDQIHMTYLFVDLLNGFRKEISSSQRVGTCTLAVGQQPTTVCAAIETLANNLTSARRTHRHHANLNIVGIGVLDAQRLLKGVQVFGVEDGRQRCTVYRALGCHGILAHVSRVWYLLGKYYNIQLHK